VGGASNTGRGRFWPKPGSSNYSTPATSIPCIAATSVLTRFGRCNRMGSPGLLLDCLCRATFLKNLGDFCLGAGDCFHMLVLTSRTLDNLFDNAPLSFGVDANYAHVFAAVFGQDS